MFPISGYEATTGRIERSVIGCRRCLIDRTPDFSTFVCPSVCRHCVCSYTRAAAHQLGSPTHTVVHPTTFNTQFSLLHLCFASLAPHSPINSMSSSPTREADTRSVRFVCVQIKRLWVDFDQIFWTKQQAGAVLGMPEWGPMEVGHASRWGTA